MSYCPLVRKHSRLYGSRIYGQHGYDYELVMTVAIWSTMPSFMVYFHARGQVYKCHVFVLRECALSTNLHAISRPVFPLPPKNETLETAITENDNGRFEMRRTKPGGQSVGTRGGATTYVDRQATTHHKKVNTVQSL